METLLLKIARQLESLDEASLSALWDKYAAVVARFEPSKRWEEAALVLSLIQAKHWKNQLFNHHWSSQVRPGKASGAPMPNLPPVFLSLEKKKTPSSERPRAKVLAFRPDSAPSPVNTAEQPLPDGAE